MTSSAEHLLWVSEWDDTIPTSAITKPKPLWSGKQIFSIIHRSPDPKSANAVFDDGTLVENGEIIFGIVEKETVEVSQDGLVHIVFFEKDVEAARDLLTSLQTSYVENVKFGSFVCIGFRQKLKGE